MTAALGTYLTADAGLQASQAQQVIDGALLVMGQALPSLGIELKRPASAGGELARSPEMPPSTVIKDVTAFKAGLKVGPAPRPREDLSMYEELEPKL